MKYFRKYFLFFTLALLGAYGCSSQLIYLKDVDQETVYENRITSALSSNNYSAKTSAVLHRYALKEAYNKNPEDTILKLKKITLTDKRQDILFAISELCFLLAKKDEGSWFFKSKFEPADTYLAAVITSYMYLLGGEKQEVSSPFSPNFRLACDIHNFALAKAFTGKNGALKVNSCERVTPIGKINIITDFAKSEFDKPEFEMFVPVNRFNVKGFQVMNIVHGLGIPFIAVKKEREKKPFQLAGCGTLLLRIDPPPASLPSNGEPIEGRLFIISTDKHKTIKIAGNLYPIQSDFSTPIAYSIKNPDVWALGTNVFFSGISPIKTDIYPVEPYDPEKIPLLFIHGTMSSPIYWSEMWNTLRADPLIRRHYQFWFYFYDSGKSMAFSAADLRDKLKEDIQKCSKEGPVKDVVVVGHSQGGLLAKMLVTDTGEKLFTAASGKTFENSGLKPADLEFVKKYSVYEHIPEIHSVIFISTPHRGSFLASSLARRLARMFISFPDKAINLQQTIDRIEDYMNTPFPLRGEMPTSLDSMAPDNPILNSLADIPVAPSVHAHSIIPIDGDEKPPEGDDGVVEYKSAHIDYVESEFVLRCDHSAQLNPLAIEEVRRILIEHLKRMNQIDNNGKKTQ